MKKLSSTDDELKKSVAYKKNVYYQSYCLLKRANKPLSINSLNNNSNNNNDNNHEMDSNKVIFSMILILFSGN